MFKLKKFTSVLLVLTLILSVAPITLAEVKEEGIPSINMNQGISITRGDALELAYETANRYNPNAERSTLIVGDGKGELRLNDSITYAEAVVLLKRAFGDIPEAVGNNKRMADPDASLTNLPRWAFDAYEELSLGGVFSGSPDANDPMDKQEFTLMLGRLIRLYGNNPKDEFYESVNKVWLDTTVFPEGESYYNLYREVGERTTAQLEVILDELAAGTYESGTPEYYVSKFYKNALDREARNAAGFDPIKKYLNSIDGVETINDLIGVHNEIREGTGRNLIFSLELSEDIRDSSQNALYFQGPSIHLAKDDYDSNNTASIAAFREYATKMLALAGENEPEVRADKALTLEKELSLSMLTPQEKYDVEIAYEESNLSKVDVIFSTVDIAKFAEAAGIHASADTRVLIVQYESVVKCAELLTDENIEAWKAYLKVRLLRMFSALLSEDFINAANEYNKAAFGVEEPISYKRRAINLTKDMLGEYLGQIYIKKHFSEETKRDVEQMVLEFIEVYRETLSANTWLSPETKTAALKKLDTLNYKIGYPDKWDDFLNGVDIGESPFDGVCEVNKAYYANMIKTQDNPPDGHEWILDVYDVNACYLPQYNEIEFPAAYLQAPFYEPNATREANLGGVGYTIAHEISHAFDSSGAQYDENGNAVNWWTASDYAEFEKRCQDIIEFYDGLEIAPGIFSNGQLTVGENIADLEGLMCTIAVAKKNPDVDLKALFESSALTGRGMSTRETAQNFNVTEVHANDRIRVNRTIQNVPEFYETYGIKEGDLMFVPASDRVKIW